MTAGTAMTPSLPQPLPFERGTVLGGRYELAELLGTGGHGAVYRAVQRPLGREVAVKVLLAETLAGEGALERLAREAGLVKRLEHPHTVRLSDFGTNESGQPFLVFELLRGRSLEDELRKGPLAIPRVAHVATQALKALMEAHGLGIVHRDIKPSNVLLLDYPGEPDFVKVLDFGVARSIETAEKAQITVAGQIIGTPAYMAPEQVDALPISPRADLYALGLVMAELIAGKPVFHHGSPVQIWMQQASPDPVPLSGVVLSSALGAVITRATKKRPEERYASAAEMLADIERAMAASVAGTDPLAKPLALSSVACRSTARRMSSGVMP